MSDSKYNEVIIQSLSKEIEGEIHLRCECLPYKVEGLLNDEKVVQVHLRKCICGEYPDKESLLTYTEKCLPRDGVVIHLNPHCKYKLVDVPGEFRTMYKLIKECYCSGDKKRTARRMDYN